MKSYSYFFNSNNNLNIFDILLIVWLTCKGWVNRREVMNEKMIDVIHWYVLSFPNESPSPKTMNAPPPIEARVINQAMILPIDGQPFVLLKMNISCTTKVWYWLFAILFRTKWKAFNSIWCILPFIVFSFSNGSRITIFRQIDLSFFFC